MYRFVQKHKKLILIVVCVFLLPFIGFTFWPILDNLRYGSRKNPLVGTFEMPKGTVHEMRAQEFDKIWRRLAYTRATRLVGIPEPTEDSVWAHITQLEEARLMGIRVSDDTIKQFVQSSLQMLGRGMGRPATYDDYKMMLSQARIRPKEFEMTVREVLVRRELEELYESSHQITMEDVRQSFQNENRNVTIRVASFDRKDFEAGLKATDFTLDGKLKEYYEDVANNALLLSKDELTHPRVLDEVEVVFARYADFDETKHADLLKDVQVTDQEAMQEYGLRRETLYKNPEPEKKPDEKKPDKPAEDSKKPGEKDGDGNGNGNGQEPPAQDPPKKPAGEDPAKKATQDKPDETTTKPGEQPKPGEPKTPAAQPATPEQPPAPYKTFEEVRDEVIKRVKLQKVMTKVLIEASDALEAAKKKAEADKAAKDQAKKDDPKDKPKVDEPLRVALDLKALAKKHGLEFLPLVGAKEADLEAVTLGGDVGGVALATNLKILREGELTDRAVSDLDGVVFFARLTKDTPKKLKALDDKIEDALRKVVMNAAAEEATGKAANDFYAAMEDKARESMKDQLQKEVYGPLDEQKKTEIATENADRVKAGKPALTAEELKVYDTRFDELKKKRESTVLTPEILAKKAGEHFAAVVKDQGVKTTEYTFWEPARPGAGRFGFDFSQRLRESEIYPVKGFLRHNGGTRGLAEVGDVGRPVVNYADDHYAAFVLQLAKVDKPDWRAIDPRTYETLVARKRTAVQQMLRFGVNRLGYQRMKDRIKLAKMRPTQPEAGGAEPVPLKKEN